MLCSLTRKAVNNVEYFFKHKLMPKGLVARSMCIILIPLLLSNLIAGFVFYDNHWDAIGRRLSRAVTGEISAMISLLDEFGGYREQKQIMEIVSRATTLDVSVIEDMEVDPSMERLKDTWNTIEMKKSLASLLKTRNTFYIDEVTAAPNIVVYLQYYSNVIRIEIPNKRFFSSTAYVFILWMTAISLLLFGIASLFLKNQIRSIVKLSKAADEFGKGRDIDFKISGASEVKQAGRAFLNMKNRIKRQLSERTYMLAGVSHDLRTPLTRMKLQLAMLKDQDSDLVAGLGQDVNVMEGMIDAYITFVKGEGKEPYTLTALSSVLYEAAERSKVKAADIEFRIKNEVTLSLRRNDAIRCFANIIGNSFRYADKTVVSCELAGNFVIVTVDDDGPGIEEEHFDEVFRAFYRIDDSRNQKTGGIGLGLTVSRDIVVAHGGEILLDRSPMGGLQVMVKLPI